MFEFLRAKGFEVLIVVIILPCFAYLCLTMWAIDTRLARVEERTQGIVSQFDEIRGDVAFDAVNGGFDAALIVSRPILRAQTWYSDVYLVNALTGSWKGYAAKLAGPDDKTVQWTVSGQVVGADRQAVSFRQMNAFATREKLPQLAPETVDLDALKAFTTIAGEEISQPSAPG